MQANRRARLASVIQQELSQVIARDLKDPRIPPLTITKVEVTEEGDQATVFFAVLGAGLAASGGEAEQAETRRRTKDCLQGLISAGGFLRRHLASALDVRHIPGLIFKEDRGLENTQRVHELLKAIQEEEK